MINYSIFERLLSPKNNYIMIEHDQNSFKRMRYELDQLNKTLTRHTWSCKPKLWNREIIQCAITQVLKGKNIKLVDACLCSSIKIMVDNGLVDSLENLITVQQSKRKHFYFSLTHSLRVDSISDKKAFIKLNKIIKQYGGYIIYKYTYRDGTPMGTTCWYI